MTDLEPLEIAYGFVLEPFLRPGERLRRPLRRSPGAGRSALEEVISEAMSQGRTSVSFSGGRDSSLVLAVATAIARREGQEDPVPVTMRHASAQSQEADWQERVIAHLGLTEWITVDVAHRMDVLGEEATAFYRRAGLRTPANAYLHLAMVEAAPAGTMLTGGGGDEVMGTQPWHLTSVLTRRVRPHPRDVLRLGYAASPSAMRRAFERRRTRSYATWLLPEAAREVSRRTAALEARTRLRWDTCMADFARSRTSRLGGRDLAEVGRHCDVRILSPLATERFVTAFAGEMGLAGPRDRSHAMHVLGGDVLPREVITRSSKATFDAVVWGPRFREFVTTWEPETLDPAVAELVDLDRLRAAWRSPEPAYQSMLLAQKAWLDQAGLAD